MIFVAIFDPSLLTVCINGSFLHLYLLFYYQFSVGHQYSLLILHVLIFFKMAAARQFEFLKVRTFGKQVCVTTPNFVAIGQIAADILRYLDF